MHRIDESRPFLPVKIAILTVSDSRTAAEDRSGDTLQRLIQEDGHEVARREICRDDVETIAAFLESCIQDPGVDVVITTGGTGVTGRDITPEAFNRVVEKQIEGLGELFRMLSYQKIGTSTCSRGPWAAPPRVPISLRCPARPVPARTAGRTSCAGSSTTAIAPATSWNSCRACRST